MPVNDQKNSAFRIPHSAFISLLLAAHLLIALPFAYYTNIWIDEASTLYTTGRGFLYAFETAAANERQAPLYFWILSLWLTINDSIFFARIFSVICSCLAIYFFLRLARKLFDENQAGFITFFFAVHPYLIWASAEIRVYSAVILLSILLLGFFCDGYLETPEKQPKAIKKARIFYCLTAVVALYTNYYLGFLLVGNFFALLSGRKIRAARSYIFGMIIVGVVFSPLLLQISAQFAGNTGGFRAERSLFEAALILRDHAFALTFPIAFSFFADLSLVALCRTAFVCLTLAAIVFFLLKNKTRLLNEKLAALAVTVVVVGLFFFAAYFPVGAEFIALRHVALLFAPLLLFFGLLLTSVLPRSLLLAFAAGFVLLFPYPKIFKQFPNFTKRGDWQRIARFIETNEKPNQPIIVFQNYEALALPIYYRGRNKILPDEKFFAWNPEDARTSERAFAKQIDFIISEIPPDAEEIWLATEENCQNEKTRAACRPLENFVQANYTIVETRDFYRERLRLLRKK